MNSIVNSQQEAAIRFFGLEGIDDEHLPDRYEEQVFQLRDYALRNTPVPAMFEQRIRQLQQVQEHFDALNGATQPGIDLGPIVSLNADEIVSFLRTYSEQMMQLKMRMATTLVAHEVAAIMKSMIHLQYQYDAGWITICKQLEAGPSTEVKIADQVDTGQLIHFIRKHYPVWKSGDQLPVAVDAPEIEEDLIRKEYHRVQKGMQLASYKGIENS